MPSNPRGSVRTPRPRTTTTRTAAERAAERAADRAFWQDFAADPVRNPMGWSASLCRRFDRWYGANGHRTE